MANNRSAEKRIRQNSKRKMRNRIVKSALRTKIKNFELAVSANDKVKAEEALKASIKSLDTAAGKGVVHKKAAARKKSRLQKKLNNLG